MFKTTKTLAALALVVLVLGAGQASAVVIIDDFQQPATAPPFFTNWLEQYVVGFGHVYPNPGSNTGLPVANTIGGRRDFELTYIGGGSAGSTSDLDIIGSPDQYLQFSNSAGVMAAFEIGYGWAVPLDWDATLPATYADSLMLDIRSTDHDSQFIVEIASGVGTAGEVHEAVVYNLPAGFTGPYIIPGEDFTSIDPTDIDEITFYFGYDTTSGPDDDNATYVADLQLSINSFEAIAAIPEPTTLALLGLGALALARRRRRS